MPQNGEHRAIKAEKRVFKSENFSFAYKDKVLY